jgi:hypothetical protein
MTKLHVVRTIHEILGADVLLGASREIEIVRCHLVCDIAYRVLL